MNIDIRNIDKDFEAAIEEIQAEHENINTGAAAVKHATLEYLYYKKQYIKEAKQLEDLQAQYNELLNNISNYFDYQADLKSAVNDARSNGIINRFRHLEY